MVFASATVIEVEWLSVTAVLDEEASGVGVVAASGAGTVAASGVVAAASGRGVINASGCGEPASGNPVTSSSSENGLVPVAHAPRVKIAANSR